MTFKILLTVHTFCFFCFQIISYDSPRGGVSVITEKGDVTASFLVVQHAKPSDSGTYSCSPSLGDTVSVNVHVLRGKQTAENVYKLWPRMSIWVFFNGYVLENNLKHKNALELVIFYSSFKNPFL